VKPEQGGQLQPDAGTEISPGVFEKPIQGQYPMVADQADDLDAERYER